MAKTQEIVKGQDTGTKGEIDKGTPPTPAITHTDMLKAAAVLKGSANKFPTLCKSASSAVNGVISDYRKLNRTVTPQAAYRKLAELFLGMADAADVIMVEPKRRDVFSVTDADGVKISLPSERLVSMILLGQQAVTLNANGKARDSYRDQLDAIAIVAPPAPTPADESASK